MSNYRFYSILITRGSDLDCFGLIGALDSLNFGITGKVPLSDLVCFGLIGAFDSGNLGITGKIVFPKDESWGM